MQSILTNGAARLASSASHVTHARGRGKRRLDPYAPIEKVPLYTADDMRSRAFSVRLEDDDAEAGWREVGTVSADYLLVANADVRAMAHDVAARSGLHFAEALTFFDGRRYALALVAQADAARVVVEGGMPRGGAEARHEGGVVVGDYVSLGLLFENAYDGSRRLSASLFAHRLACSNGMLASDLFARVRYRHTHASRGWGDDLARSLAMLAGAQTGLRRFARSASRLARHGLGTAELATLRGGYLDRLPVTLWGRVVDRYLASEAPTAWGLMNAGTHELWHAERMTRADLDHNAYLTSNLLRYADEQLEANTVDLERGLERGLERESHREFERGTDASNSSPSQQAPEQPRDERGDGADHEDGEGDFGAREAA